MTKPWAMVVLLAAAMLEAGGDALMRKALRAPQGLTRGIFFAAAGVVLFTYGWTVNAPAWNFGRLLGLYVVFFVVMAQLISWLIFGETPSRAVLAGCGLIVCGGMVIALAPA